jgi:AraC family transcriptional regulator
MKYFTKGKYLGSTKCELESEGNFMMITSYWNCPDSDWHYHENSFFTFVLNGGCQEVRKGYIHESRPGDLLYFEKGIIHKNSRYTQYSRNFNLELSDKWLTDYDVQFKIEPAGFALRKCDFKFLFIRLYDEFLNQDSASSVSMNNILLQIMGNKIHEIRSGTPSWVPKIKEFLYDNWATNFTLKELSAIVGIHPVTISKNFTRYFGCTLGEYIRKIRIEKAIGMIRTTNLTLTDIAFTCGFADQSHFIRTFTKYTGTLPLHFRKI